MRRVSAPQSRTARAQVRPVRFKDGTRNTDVRKVSIQTVRSMRVRSRALTGWSSARSSMTVGVSDAGEPRLVRPA